MAATDDAPQQFANAQYEIYLQGMAGKVPELPITYAQDWSARRKRLLTAGAYGYVAGGAGAERRCTPTAAAFDRWRIVPRMLRDVGVRDMRTELLGTQMPAPS